MASKGTKKQNHLVIISIIILLVVSGVVFYCIKAYVEKQKNKSVVITNTITMNYTSDYNGIIIPATATYSDEEGKKLNNVQNIFDFVVSSKINNSTKTKYSLFLKKDDISSISDDMIRVYLESSDDENFSQATEELVPTKFKKNSSKPENGMLLKSVELSKNSKKYYRLRVWIDKSYVIEKPNDYFKATVNIIAN